MMQAIAAVYPESRLQRCIVHQIRSSTKYVSYKDIKQVVADLKKIYTAVTLEEAEEALRVFGDTWRKQYPSCIKSWEVLKIFFEYPTEIRKIIYTTNIIEGLNRQFRQITKNKPSFTNDDSLRRMLYLASQRIVKHWHARCQNWDMHIPLTECIQTAHFVHGFRRKRARIPSRLCMNSAQLNIDKLSVVWYHSNALAVTEDRATQECDLSAGYGIRQDFVLGKSDAMDGVALLFSLLYACYHSSRKPLMR